MNFKVIQPKAEKHLKRITAVALCMIIMLSGFAIIKPMDISVSAAAGEIKYSENSLMTADNWTVIEGDIENESHFTLSGNTAKLGITKNEEGAEKPYAVGRISAKGLPEGARITEFSYSVKTAAEQLKRPLELIYDFESLNSYKALGISGNKTSSLAVYKRTQDTYINQQNGTKLSPEFTAKETMGYNATFDVVFTYTYDAKGNATAQVTLTNTNATASVSYDLGTVDNPCAILSGGSNAGVNLSNTYGEYSNVSVKYYVKPDMTDFVASFKSQYPIANLEAIDESNAEESESQANAAIAAREALTDTDQYESLDKYMLECNAVIVKARTFTNSRFTDDFSDEFYTQGSFKISHYRWPTNTPLEDVIGGTFQNTNGLLKMSVSGANNAYAPVYELDAGYRGEFSMATGSFYRESGVFEVSAATQRLMYFTCTYGQKDETTGRIPITAVNLQTFYPTANKAFTSKTIIDEDAAWTTDIDDPSGWLRFLISVNSSGYPVVSIVNCEGIAIVSVTGNNKECVLDTNLPIAVSVHNGTAYLDDFIVFYGLDSSVEYTKTRKNFLKKYAELLMLNEETVTKYYKSQAEEALTTYNALEDDDPLRYGLLSEAAYIRDLLAYMNENCDDGYLDYVRAKDDYADFTEDFENGLNKWYTNGNVSIVTDDDTNSNVVNLHRRSYLYPKSYVIPEKALLKKVSYQMKAPDGLDFDNGRYIQFIYNYHDPDNYEELQLYRQTGSLENSVTWRRNIVIDGQDNVVSMERNNFFFDFTDWFTVSFTYNGYDVEFELDNGTEYIYRTIKREKLDGIFALGSYIRSDRLSTLYYDNLTVSWEKGDWDVDDEIDQIYTYYKGNTQVGGDDTVVLSGEKLYDTVYSVRVMQLDNNDSQTAGYILQNNHNYSAVEGKYFDSVPVTVPAESDLWNTSAKKVKIIQATSNGIKFTLPAEFTTGIYAVKLYGENALSHDDDTVIYLNLPHIEGYVADEGKIATHGGYIQFTGEFLGLDVPMQEDDMEEYDYLPTKTDDIKIRLRNESGQYIINDVTVLSPYSVKAGISSDIPFGKYEAVLYNGYGDDTCWSLPIEVEIGASPRDSWSKNVFNVADFGATGSKEQNATPYIVKALAAAADNNGGIVYFPKGIYNLFHSVVIPENVKIMGDGTGNSIVFWSPDQWRMNHLLEYQIAFTENVEFCDIAFYGTRMGSVYKFYSTDAQNIYFNNCLVYVNPFAGSPTETGGATLDSTTDIWMDIWKENADYETMVWCSTSEWNRVENLQINNVRFENATDYQQRRAADLRNCRYTQVRDCYLMAGWTLFWGTNIIWDSNITDFATMAVLGENVYYANSTLKNRVDNNRELFVADWSAGSFSGGIDVTLKEVPGSGGLKYTCSKSYSSGFLDRGYQIYVTYGQGRGQTRVIKSNIGNIIELYTPFVIKPNSNSKVTIRVTRQNNFFVDNYYFNGSAGGYFGGYANVIYDSNLHERHSNFYQNSRSNDNNWFTSYVNEIYRDPYVMYKYGSDNSYTDNVNKEDYTGYGKISFIGQNTDGSMFHVIRNNSYDGYYILFNTSINNAISDVVIENNTFHNTSVAIYNCTNNTLDGVLYRNNLLLNIGKYINYVVNGTRNTQGYVKEIIVKGDLIVAFIPGDVTGDGEVTLKDCTTLRYYFAELTVLSADQLERADMNQDGKINLRDISAIRKYIVEGPQIEPPTESGSSSEESSSNDVSSDNSSSEDTSTDNSSSDDTSTDNSSSNDTSTGGSSSDDTSTDDSSSSNPSEDNSSTESDSKEYFPGIY